MNKKELFEFYCNHFSNWISGGTLVNRGNLSSLGIRALFSQIVTKQYIRRVVCIGQFPVDYNEPLLEVLQDLASEISSDSKIMLNSCSRVSEINVMSDDFNRKMKEANANIDKYKEVFSELTDSEKISGKTVMQNGFKFSIDKKRLKQYQDSYDSYKYTYGVIESGGSMSKSFLFVDVMDKEQKNVMKITKEICNYLSVRSFKFKELSANSSYYLNNFCPASKSYETESKEFRPVLLSDENLSYLRSFNTDGFIGDGHGQLLGMNAGSKTPFILNFFESGSGQIILIEAPTGYGKTINAFQLAMSMLSSGVHVSALDVKGKEWVKLINLLNLGIEIDISEDSKTYVNTLRLDDLDVDSVDEAREFYNMSITATATLMELVTKPKDSDETTQCRHVARKAVKNLFDNHEINPQAFKSFKRTSELRYDNLIGVLDKMKTSPSLKPYHSMIDKMISRCNSKFRESNVFKGKEILLSDVINCPLVVYSLNRNSDIETDDESIKTFMIGYLDKKKLAMRKRMHEHTMLFYEEMQRKEEFISFIKLICGNVTGSRSSNAVVALLCNSLQTFEDKDMAPIASNISTAFIGPLTNERDYDTLDAIGCRCLEGKIRAITNNPKKSKNFFAVKYNTGKISGTTIYKCILPQYVIDKLKTRDEMVKNVSQ